MPVKVQCPNPACGKSGTFYKEQIGQSVRCPYCLTEFTMPGVTTLVSEPSVHAADLDVAPSPFAPAPSSLPQKIPQSTPETPERIGRFEIRARLGAGAFGTVYRAYDPQLEREVALKVPQENSANNPPRIQRFLREAKVAARLRHAHIVPVFDAGLEGKYYYIASAFIEGRTLAEVLDDGPLDCRRAAEIVRDLAEALAYAHDLGIVHRDVKPANVMVDSRGAVHLMDFGLARRQDSTTRLTRVGALLGTPAYMAPEQAQGQTGEVKPAGDQYSLGVIFYELLCGQQPFQGPPKVVLFNAVHKAPPPPRTVNPEVPAELEAICLKVLAKRPEDRYPDCKELAGALERWLQTARSSPEIAAAFFAPAPARPATGTWIAVGVGTAVLILGTVLTVWIMVNTSGPAGEHPDQSKAPRSLVPANRNTAGGHQPHEPPKPVAPPVRLSMAGHVTLSPGERHSLVVRIDRADYQGPIQFKLEGLPPGVKVVNELFIPARTTVKTFDLDARDDAPEVEGRKVHVQALGERPLGQCAFQLTIKKPASAKRRNPSVFGLDLDDVHVSIVQAPVRVIDYVQGKGVGVLATQQKAKVQAEALHFAEKIRPTRMVVVTSTFPYRKQAEAFRKALLLPRLGEGEAIPRFLGFDVERRVTGPDGEAGEWRRFLLAPRPNNLVGPGRNAEADEWQRLGSTFRDLLAAAPAVEPLDRKLKPLALPGLVMPLPALARGLSYPTVQLQGIPNRTPADPGPGNGPPPPDKAADGVPPFNKDMFPWDQLLDSTRDKLSGKSIQFFHPDGGMAKAAPPQKPKAGKVLAIPEKCLFRFVDVEVQPGYAYAYRIVLCLANPNFGKTKEVADAQDARVEVLRSQPDILPEVKVPSDVFSYAVDEKALQRGYGKKANPAMVGAEKPSPLAHLVPFRPDRPLANQEAVIQIHRWVDRVPDRNIDVGYWLIAERLLFHRGEYLQRDVALQVPRWIQTEEQFKIVGKPAIKKDKPRYAVVPFGTSTQKETKPALLVDIYGAHQEVKVGPKMTVIENSAEELLVLTPEGDLSVWDGREHSNPKSRPGRERLERYQAWKGWIERITEGYQDPTKKKKDPFGK